MTYKMKDKGTLMNISEIKNYVTKYTKQFITVNSETSKGMLLGKTAKGKDNCSIPSRLIYTHKRAGEKKRKKQKEEKKKESQTPLPPAKKQNDYSCIFPKMVSIELMHATQVFTRETQKKYAANQLAS